MSFHPRDRFPRSARPSFHPEQVLSVAAATLSFKPPSPSPPYFRSSQTVTFAPPLFLSQLPLVPFPDSWLSRRMSFRPFPFPNHFSHVDTQQGFSPAFLTLLAGFFPPSPSKLCTASSIFPYPPDPLILFFAFSEATPHPVSFFWELLLSFGDNCP